MGVRYRNRAQDSLLVVGFLLTLVLLQFLLPNDPKLLIIGVALVFLAAAYFHYRQAVGQEMLVALFFALFVTSYQAYLYDTPNLLIGHINLYPLVAWTAGLVVLREVYERVHAPYRWLLVSVAYVLVLFVVEYCGYYWLGIHLGGGHPSLWGLGIIHGPPFIHVFYLLAGPTYLLATDYLRVR